ncbi:hypothetical protein FB192DRAFT_1260757, partial [Mucor lusitanicus]
YRTQRILRQVPGASYARTHFPIVPTFATAIHKVQSATIDCVGVFFDHMLTHGHFKKATHLYFFGAPTPLDISRHFGVDVEAI